MNDIEELDSEIEQIKLDINRMQKEYDASIKDLTKRLLTVENGTVDKTECVSTNGGLMTTDLDMQKYPVLNIPLPGTDNEPKPVTTACRQI